MPNLFTLEHELDGMQVRGAIVLGNTRAMIWDTLIYPEQMQAVLDICGNRELIIVYSHGDWDHVWGTCTLPYQKVIGHKRCKARFDDPDDVAKTLKDYQAKYSALINIHLVAPTETFEDRLELDLGSLTVELCHLPGHTLDGIVAFIPELGTLLVGDACETPLPLVYEDSPLSQWITALENWQKNPRVKTVIPSHGPTGNLDLVKNTTAYLKAVKDENPIVLPDLDEFYQAAHEKNKSIAPHLP